MKTEQPKWLDRKRPKHNHSWLYVLQTAREEIENTSGNASHGARILREETSWAREMTAQEHLQAAAWHAECAADILRTMANRIDEPNV